MARASSKRWALRTSTVADDQRLAVDLEDFHVEDDRRVRWHNDVAVGIPDWLGPEPQGVGYDEPPRGARRHPDHALFEPIDDAAEARCEDQRAAQVARAVELGAVQ